ncbi:helix-turn-helix transcriptional regulator [Nocardioides houyundeii]|uniref:helix-turn-helix transcriptional regulator n=1 Tax=Nocardioides houyundeii TaxID=2045452 RepID=UPI001963D36B|nr:helix-turn-helix transcriptional regulator [Nocardioides houyundeii]
MEKPVEDPQHDGRGVLYPASLPSFHRLPPPDAVAHLVRWFWIPEWDLAPGRSSRQHVISFPASNLVVEPGFVALAGPTTRASHRDLAGRGWAVGALLRPAAVRLVTDAPGAVRDDYLRLDLPDLHAPVVAAMISDQPREDRRDRAVAAFAGWLAARGPSLASTDEAALLANAMTDLIDSDPEVVRVEQVAEHLGVSVRTVQRLAVQYVGLSPAAMIRRRRLQEAVELLRRAPDTDLSTVAADLGYADQAHLAGDFRSVLGFTPSAYRSQHRERSTDS